MRKRIKVEITDEEGTRYSLALHGKFSQEKVIRMMEVLDFLGDDKHSATAYIPSGESTIYGKIAKIIETTYPAKEFSSADIARDYEELHTSTIGLSTVSTYLSRLADRGFLKRQKFGNSWVYRLSRAADGQLVK